MKRKIFNFPGSHVVSAAGQGNIWISEEPTLPNFMRVGRGGWLTVARRRDFCSNELSFDFQKRYELQALGWHRVVRLDLGQRI